MSKITTVVAVQLSQPMACDFIESSDDTEEIHRFGSTTLTFDERLEHSQTVTVKDRLTMIRMTMVKPPSKIIVSVNSSTTEAMSEFS